MKEPFLSTKAHREDINSRINITILDMLLMLDTTGKGKRVKQLYSFEF